MLRWRSHDSEIIELSVTLQNYAGIISSRISWTSEISASESPEHIDDMFPIYVLMYEEVDIMLHVYNSNIKLYYCTYIITHELVLKMQKRMLQKPNKNYVGTFN